MMWDLYLSLSDELKHFQIVEMKLLVLTFNGRGTVLCIDGFDKKYVQLLAQDLDTFWKVYAHVEPIQINCKCGNHSQECYYCLCFGIEEFGKVQ